MDHLHIYVEYGSSIGKIIPGIECALMQKTAQDPHEFTSYLELPLQRLFTYSSILAALARTLDEGCSRSSLLQAAEEMCELSCAVGSVSLPSSQQMAVAHMQPLFAWPGSRRLDLTAGGRHLVRFGSFTKLSGKGEIIARRVLLFSDVCIICQELRSKQCLIRSVLPMKLCLVTDHGESSNSFSIIRRDTNEGGVFSAGSREEKENWIEALNTTLLHCVSMECLAGQQSV